MIERYKDIKGYENLYQVSNLGNIKSLRTNKLLKHNLLQGYPIVQLSVNGERHTFEVHRLIAEAFIPNPNNYPFVNHINENRSDNRIDNLEWCNQKMNVNHSRRKLYRKLKEEDYNTNKFIYIKKCSTKHKGKQYTYNFYRVSIPRINIDKIFSKYEDAFEFRNKCLPLIKEYYNNKQLEFKL